MFAHLTAHHRSKGKAPSYDEIVSRSRTHAIENYAFQGTKLDISKEMPGRSIFSLSNTDRGVSMNYSLNRFSKTFSISMFGDGSVLGKVSPSNGDGFTLTWMKGVAHRYFEAGITKSSSVGSLTLKVINPDLGENITNCFTRDSLHSKFKSISSIIPSKSALQQKGTEIGNRRIFGNLIQKPSISGITSSLEKGISKIPEGINGGIFSAAGVLQILPGFHLAGESVLSISKKTEESTSPLSTARDIRSTWPSIAEQYAKEVSSTFIVSKIFDTWRAVGICHLPGPAGIIIEKALDESVSVHSEVSVDYRNILSKSKSFFESVGCAAGITITGETTVTRVSAASNGTATASSDIAVGEGATLNLSGQVSFDGPLLGIGFTLSS